MLDQAYYVLKECNLRITPQRKAILQILNNSRGHHLEIDSIYELLAVKGDKRIGLATVYRTMELFEKIGLVSRLSMEKSPARYELIIHDKSRHHHLICLKCGQVQEIDDRITEEFKNRIMEEKEFEVADKPMKIYGYCNKCREELKYRD
ncbi:MAG: Fur family transcriptional regulator [Clostridia bacterium BRH_c25]|nr:MAG: Fur family transcriptional regulator [Clostridia bacterium BRH_c25]